MKFLFHPEAEQEFFKMLEDAIETLSGKTEDCLRLEFYRVASPNTKNCKKFTK